MAIKIEPNSTYTDKPLLLHRSVFDSGTVAVSNETVDGSGLNCLEDTTFDYWDTDVASAEIEVDYGSEVYCDCVGIDAHTIGTDGATVAVEWSDDGGVWNEVWSYTPTDNTCIVGIFPLTKARYWRVSVTDGPAIIGVMKLGRRVIIPTGVLTGHTAINNSSTIEMLSNDSITGQFLGNRIIRVGSETTINFGQIYSDWVDDNLDEFQDDFNECRTFFYAGSPEKTPLDFGYCKRSGGELRPPYSEGREMLTVSFSVQVFSDATSGRGD